MRVHLHGATSAFQGQTAVGVDCDLSNAPVLVKPPVFIMSVSYKPKSNVA